MAVEERYRRGRGRREEKKRGKNGTINDSTGYAGQNRSSNETIFNRTIWTSDTGTNAR